MPRETMSREELEKVDAYWRAANYLTVGQIYLLANPLLREPLRPEHIKPRLLGHWGTSPGLSLVYAHLNRIIQQREPRRHLPRRARARRPGGPRQRVPRRDLLGDLPRRDRGRARHARLFRQFSTPGGVPSHVGPSTPGSIHEGGELGYVLTHAFGAVFDNPESRRGRGRRRRRGRDRAARRLVEGDPLPQRRARRRGAADPAPERIQDLRADRARSRERRVVAQLARGARLRRALRRGGRATRRAPGARGGARRLLRRASARSRRRRAPSGGPRHAALAGDRPADAEGVDRARRRSTACRSRGRSARTRCRSPRVRDGPRAARDARSVDASYEPERLFDASGRLVAIARGTLAPKGRGGWGRTRTPTAAPWRSRSTCPTSRLTPSPSPRTERCTTSRRAQLGAMLRDIYAQEPEDLPPLLPRRDELEPPRRRLRGREALLPGADDRHRRPRLAPRGA